MPKDNACSRRCELCGAVAAIYCPSDSAYLCWNCDSAVHSANFLVARHLRSVLCTSCGEFDGGHFSGAGLPRSGPAACNSCGRLDSSETENDDNNDNDNDDEYDSSLSSVSVTTNESSTCARDRDCCGEVSSVMRRRDTRIGAVDARVEGVLVNWCRRLGLEGDDDVVLEAAGRALGATGSLGRLAVVPVRVALAASFWVGLRFCGDTCRDLRRVENVTGVPARMILALEAKLERVLKTRKRVAASHDKEGWAEC